MMQSSLISGILPVVSIFVLISGILLHWRNRLKLKEIARREEKLNSTRIHFESTSNSFKDFLESQLQECRRLLSASLPDVAAILEIRFQPDMVMVWVEGEVPDPSQQKGVRHHFEMFIRKMAVKCGKSINLDFNWRQNGAGG